MLNVTRFTPTSTEPVARFRTRHLEDMETWILVEVLFQATSLPASKLQACRDICCVALEAGQFHEGMNDTSSTPSPRSWSC
mmetsp:Transcript_27759/g.40876  ORF Transcript_27759/g.40876 Transcript_27759/m.40876 type:complete len:81 (-) Transcript_27759:247-489(-)